LIEMPTAEKNRLRLAARPIQKRVQAHIAWLEKELASTNTDLTATIRESPVWREKEEVLRSVPGVGPVLVTTLFANLPELGTLTRKEVATLAGVAPFHETAVRSKDDGLSGAAASTFEPPSIIWPRWWPHGGIR